VKYTLTYTKRAVKDIQSLDQLARKRLGKKLIALSKNPIKLFKKLINPDLGTYRYRIGDYRVIFDIVDEKIIILRVGHRKEIYR